MDRKQLIPLSAIVCAFVMTMSAAQGASPPAPRLPPIASPTTNPYVNQAAALRAAPLPRDTLAGGSALGPPPRAPYSVPYGPRFSRPSGSAVIPFGSSRYYYPNYHR